MYKYVRMKELRIDNDKGQKEVANELKISQQKYSEYERGQREIPLHLMIELARYYHVSMDYICSKVERRGAV